MDSGGRVRFGRFCSQQAAAGKPVGQIESARFTTLRKLFAAGRRGAAAPQFAEQDFAFGKTVIGRRMISSPAIFRTNEYSPDCAHSSRL